MTPEQEQQVRRALRAAAAADEPARMPPEVADRLDDVLADLTGDREHAGQRADQPGAQARDDVGIEPDGPDELAARRRRRWKSSLVAAAAVAVIAVAGAAVATGGFGTDGKDQATTAGKAAGSTADNTAPSTTPSPSTPTGRRGPSAESAGNGVVPDLHSTTLGQDVQQVLRTHRTLAGGAKAPRTTNDLPVGCARPFTGRGASLFVVRLDGRPATLVVGPVQDGERQARIYSCDGVGNPLASVSVPAR